MDDIESGCLFGLGFFTAYGAWRAARAVGFLIWVLVS